MTDRLQVGAVINRVFQIYVEQAPVLLPVSAVVFVISGIIASLLVVAGHGLAVLGFLISFVAGTLFTGMIVELVADLQDGRRDHSPGQLLRAVAPVLGQLILVGIVAAIGIAIGFVLIIVPGLILITIWAVAAPVVVLEQPGVFRALGRSRELVSGNGWQVFGVVFLLAFLIQVVAGIVDIAAASASTGVGIVVRVILGVLIGPLSALAAAVLYFELRKTQQPARAEQAPGPDLPPAQEAPEPGGPPPQEPPAAA